MTEQKSSSGVQELINRLSEEGVAEGQRRANEMLDDARRKSDEILQNARTQADEILSSARREADEFRTASEEALKLAARDSVRDLAAQIHGRFQEWLQRMLRQELGDQQLLRDMILELVTAARPDPDRQLRILLPPEVVTDEELQRKIQAGEPDRLLEFVRGLVGSSIREGIEFSTGQNGQVGIRVQVLDDDIEIELTEEALLDVLLTHLLPRFRASLRND